MSITESRLKYKIDDDANIRTNFILSGKQLSDTAKQMTVDVVKYYVYDVQSNNAVTETQRKIVEDVTAYVKSNPNFTYDGLVQLFGAESSFETLMSYLLTGFMTSATTDPMRLLMYTYGRALPLDGEKEWMDNFRINNFGYPLNMFVWGKYDNDKVYSVHEQEPKPINESIELLDYHRVYDLLVTPFRGIILHNLDNNLGYTDYKKMCDACYNRFACCYCGAHGCDVFTIPNMSLSIPEIRQVLDRYPSWHIEYVLNTATYASRSGVHWVALELTYDSAKLICSQASNFGCFTDDNIANNLPKYNFKLIYNTMCVQHDGYNCGIFSPIALYMLLIYDGDIIRAVREGIGDNGVNIHGTKQVSTDINGIRKNVIGKR